MLPYPTNPRTSRPSPSQWALQLGRIFERVAVFAIGGTSAQVVAVRGLGHRALGVTLSLVERTPLRWAIEAASPVVGSGRAPGGDTIPEALGLDPPRAYAVIPLAMPGGIVGLAYADVGGKALSLPQVTAAFSFCQRVLEGGSAPVAAHRPSRRRPRLAKPRSQRTDGAKAAPRVEPGERGDLGIVAATFGPMEPGLETETPEARCERVEAAVASVAEAHSVAPSPAAPQAANDVAVAVYVDGRSQTARQPTPRLDAAPTVACSRSTEDATPEPLPAGNHDLEATPDDELDAPSWTPPSALQRAHELLGQGDDATLFSTLVQESMSLRAADNDGHDSFDPELPEIDDVIALEDPATATAEAPPVPIIPSAPLWVWNRRAIPAAAAGPAAAEASVAPEPTAAAEPAVAEASAAPEPTAPRSDLTPSTALRHASRPLLHARSRWARRGPGATPAPDGLTARLPEAQPEIVPAPVHAEPRVPTMTTVYADQVAVVTPGGVVPLSRPARHIGVLRAVSTSVAAVASLVAVVLTLVAPASAPTTPARSVTIPPQASLASIARELEADGLVRSAVGFTWLARLSGADRALRAGTYRLSPGAWAWQQLRALTGGQLDTATVTVPEGLTMREIAEIYETHGLARADDFVAAASDPDVLSRYDLPGPTAEGFLFPNTYTFARGLAARDLVEVMIREFFGRVSTLPAAAHATRDELVRRVVLASIVEREARDKAELARIAGVFENRISRNMKLESCATVQYVLGHRKDRLSLADVRRPSPYNTYLIHGLPPGAISNPGFDALRAAFAPEHNDLLFFFAREDGSHRHVFTRTYAEHMSAQRLVARRD